MVHIKKFAALSLIVLGLGQAVQAGGVTTGDRTVTTTTTPVRTTPTTVVTRTADVRTGADTRTTPVERAAATDWMRFLLFALAGLAAIAVISHLLKRTDTTVRNRDKRYADGRTVSERNEDYI